jgi:hypothetical protein
MLECWTWSVGVRIDGLELESETGLAISTHFITP